MSAYLCNPQQIGIIAAAAVGLDAVIRQLSRGTNPEIAQNVADLLSRENIRSVAHRYPNDTSGNRPGPALEDEDYVEACKLYAGHFVSRPPKVSPAQLAKWISCLDYQSCETDDWEETQAFDQLRHIESAILRNGPEYDAADWQCGIKVSEVEALIWNKTTC